jgi:hypothetical protein
VKVVKETDKTYTVEEVDYRGKPRERRVMRSSSPLFDTFDEAKGYLVDLKIKDIEFQRKHLERLNGELGTLKGLKEKAQ